ncbi:molybdate ABC transporter permease subunit [Campylobacter sp.]|uniref:molybdate ABC transporter permease subunit n=1 Tax=Campylobacter sp. TaxID=205 RepID=UPI002A5926DB|nr:molybdate ABC transporter permease subunit [Campylobacter sp.]MDD6162945.1 molybdate ABC transporter permease subunit [Campylobacteraceae bacterium]MCI6565016.1 molybdate ABC transporter permease subunit [Campylobacter sp.]MCI6579945.1 molybdate ABC transporter permease subunit [Campylobacter sp.]MDD7090407.1 molybdate ABC transporter permease subunit [Campylobacteraceae bacterium]MDY5284684.1 molybdate ABC transporter permease subunit [Campylobacter sp.]
MDFSPFYLSFKLAFISTLILLVFCVPLAYFLSRVNFKGKSVIEAIISLPLVLPPSVLGFYILVFLSPYSTIGSFFEEHFGIRLVFNFTGLVIASCIYSLPFMFAPLLGAFNSLPKNIIEASYTLGKGRITTMLKIALPNIKPSLLNAIIISFAHTLGEFGVVLIIGGSLSRETKVASIAIYEATEMLDFTTAHIYSGIMLAISFFVLFCVYFLTKKMKKD